MKTIQVLKAILTGAIIGAALFFIPFPFRFLFIFFLVYFSIRFFAWGRWRRGYWHDHPYRNYFWNPSYTQRWQSMSDEERKDFIKKMETELFKTNITSE